MISVVNDCGKLNPDSPLMVNTPTTVVNSTANYTCPDGFTISNGDAVRVCQPNGTWGGTEPTCLGK